MALVVKDRVKVTTATTGTGTLTLGSAVAGFQAFSAVLSNADTTYYAIFESSTGAWEVGLGTYASPANTLARTTILESSNAGSAINLTAGDADVFITQPAEKAVYLDANGYIFAADGRNLTNLNASNISSGTIGDAYLPATISSDITGNAATATKWATGKTISLTGDVTGTSGTFDGSANISFATTIAANSVALGTDTTGNYVAAGAVSGNGLSGSASAEGATFTVTSNATNANTPSTIVFRDASGNFSAGTITANLTGTASSATNADTVDSLHASQFIRSDAADTATGVITFTDRIDLHEIRTNTGQEVIINVGESATVAAAQTAELLYVNAENGLEVNASPDNWASGWAGRVTHTLDATIASFGTYIQLPQRIQHTGDTDTYMEFHAADQWRVVTGGVERLEATNSGIRIDDAFTLPTTDGTSGQALVTNGSGTVTWGSAGISTGKAIAMAIVFG